MQLLLLSAHSAVLFFGNFPKGSLAVPLLLLPVLQVVSVCVSLAFLVQQDYLSLWPGPLSCQPYIGYPGVLLRLYDSQYFHIHVVVLARLTLIAVLYMNRQIVSFQLNTPNRFLA